MAMTNFRDLSSARGDAPGFQFEFFCERCGNGYRSDEKTDVKQKGKGILRAATGLLGSVVPQLYQVSDTLSYDRGNSSKEKNKAFDEAVEAVREAARQMGATATLKAVVAKTGGAMKITGRLADGTSISLSVKPSLNADYAVWLKLYSNKGYLGGALEIEETAPGVYAADAETGGDFVWFRAPNPKSKVYPGGIDLLLAPTLAKP